MRPIPHSEKSGAWFSRRINISGLQRTDFQFAVGTPLVEAGALTYLYTASAIGCAALAAGLTRIAESVARFVAVAAGLPGGVMLALSLSVSS